MDKTKIYENITAKIIAGLEESRSWTRLWQTAEPISLEGHRYRGLNRLILNCSDYKSNVWGSFKQITDWGGKVRKGEHGHHVVYWRINKYEKDEDNVKVEKTFLMERWYYIFNTEQADFDDRGTKRIQSLGAAENANVKITTAEQIVSSLPYDIEIENKTGIRCPCYIPMLDKIMIYPMPEFNSSADYYSVLFHELVHSTGIPSRLNRYDIAFDSFGSENYSKEELVAELGAAFMCGVANIDSNIQNSSAYIQGWSRQLRANPDWLISAVSKARKAVDFLTQNVVVETEEVEEQASA